MNQEYNEVFKAGYEVSLYQSEDVSKCEEAAVFDTYEEAYAYAIEHLKKGGLYMATMWKREKVHFFDNPLRTIYASEVEAKGNPSFRVCFFRNPESNAYACYSFIGGGTLNTALRHAKERMTGESFVRAEVWQEAAEGAKPTLLHTFEEKDIAYIDMLITPTREEVIESFSKPRRYETMYPATDSELLEAIERYGGFESVAFERIGHNVAIADGAIVVALKPQPIGVNTLYVIEGRELPLPDDKRSGLNAKVWATPAVLEDIRKAEESLLAQLRKQ